MHTGSCHCGRIAFEVEGDFTEVKECNCSHCSRKGYLLSFVPREQLHLKCAEDSYSTYFFHKHVIAHHFCPICGCAPFATGKGPAGVAIAAINVRCLENIDLATLRRVPVDGRSR
ncbi:MAG TPA: GFA family protein [Steroidobacteraceae bacterium]|nr:GFA family protein [Steroidobacteraceae bacterium]